MVKKRWIRVALSKKQICFLDGISKNCKFSGGSKLKRTSIIRAFLIVGTKLNINTTKIRSEKELKRRIVASFLELNLTGR